MMKRSGTSSIRVQIVAGKLPRPVVGLGVDSPKAQAGVVKTTRRVEAAMNHTAVADKMVRLAFVSGFFAGLILGSAGCAGMVKNKQGVAKATPPAVPATGTHADQQGAANVATGAITGLSYQSVLPMGMVILLTVIVLSQTAANAFEDLLLHRQQILRLKRNGEHP
jgi:hypothetical protein